MVLWKGKDYSLYNGIPKKYKYIRNKQFNEWEIAPWDLVLDQNVLLGEGSSGKVYLGEWRRTPVAAKIINEDIEPEKREQYIREFDTLSKMHHPNIVQLLGYIEDPFVIVMEYLPNGSLYDYMKNKKLKISEKISISINILTGLTYLHNRKPGYVIHRDIKTKNILISPSGFAKIGDFGLSKIIKNSSLKQVSSLQDINEDSPIFDDDTSNNSPCVGTLRYMSPEMKGNKDYNTKVDIWSVGVIIAELFENKKYEDSFSWSKNTPSEVKEIIVKYMLRDDEKDRLSACELITLFEFLEINNSSKCLIS